MAAEGQPHAEEWHNVRRQRMDEVLHRVISTFGCKPSPEDLHIALVHAARYGDGESAVKALSSTQDDYALAEAQLSKALHTLKGLQCSFEKHVRLFYVRVLIHLRYTQSEAAESSGAANIAPAERDEAWRWVDTLLAYSGDLVRKLDCAEAEVDDECVLLATISVLAIRAVKGSFKATYAAIPWQEMEFLLVSFAASHSELQPEVAFVATAERTRRHLTHFQTLVERFKRFYGAADARVFGRLAAYPKKSRAEYLRDLQMGGMDGVKDYFPDEVMFKDWKNHVDAQGTKDLLADCATLRDWKSLRDVKEALEVAAAALNPDNQPQWDSCGRLALPMALVRVGERVKNSWESPNLSAHFANRIQMHLSEGVTKRLQDIRDSLLHDDHGVGRGTFYRRLESVRQMTERDKAESMKSVEQAKLVVNNFIVEAADGIKGYGLESVRYIENCLVDHSLMLAVGEEWKVSDAHNKLNELVVTELRKLGSDIADVQLRKDYGSMIDKDRALRDFGLPDTLSSKPLMNSFNQLPFRFEVYRQILSTVARARLPPEKVLPVLNRVRSVLFNKEFCYVQNHVKSYVKTFTGPSDSEVRTWQDELLRILESLSGMEPSDMHTFATESVLLALASLCPDDSPSPPCVDLAGPVLFGKMLRNYLAHKDVFIAQCLEPELELSCLISLLVTNLPNGAGLGARPRLRTTVEAKGEFDRLLRLVRAKGSMFRHAARGDLDGLRRAAEEHPYLDLACKDCRGRTLLHVAARGGYAGAVQWLLDSQAVDPRASDLDPLGGTALHGAASEEVAKLLIQDGCPVRSDNELSPLISALWSGRTEVARLLLEKSRNNSKAELMGAVASGCEETVRLLLEATPPPSDSDLCEALKRAAHLGHLAVVTQLLQSVENPCDASRDALFFSVEGGHVDVLKALLRFCPDDEAETWRSGNGPSGASLLHLAVSSNREDMVDFLLEKAPSTVSLRSEYGCTPLHYALFSGSLGVARKLLAAMPEAEREMPYRRRRMEMSPLCFAALSGNVGLVEELVDRYGMSVEQAGRGGCTALHAASLVGRTGVVRSLLDRGADRGVVWDCRTPLCAAVMGGYLDVVRVLMEKGSPAQLLQLLKTSPENDWLRVTLDLHAVTIAKYLLNRERELMKSLGWPQHAIGHTPSIFTDNAGMLPLALAVKMLCPREMVELLLDNMWDLKCDAYPVTFILEKVLDAFWVAVKTNNLVLAEAIHEWDRKQGGGRPDPVIFARKDLLREALSSCSPDMARLLLGCMWRAAEKKKPSEKRPGEKDVLDIVKEALFDAVSRNNTSRVKCILEWELQLDPVPKYKKKDIKPLVFQDKDRTPLSHALDCVMVMRNLLLLFRLVPDLRRTAGLSERQVQAIHCSDRMVLLLQRFMREPKFQQRAGLSAEQVEKIISDLGVASISRDP